jgi:hypothetical protein
MIPEFDIPLKYKDGTLKKIGEDGESRVLAPRARTMGIFKSSKYPGQRVRQRWN